MASSQITKTTMLLCAALGLSMVRPSPAMLVSPDTKANTDLRTRAYQIAEASHELKECIPPKHAQNDLWLDLTKSKVYLGIAENKQTLSSKACRRVFCTEVDRYDRKKTGQGDTLKLAFQRVMAFPAAGRLVFCESTPQLVGASRIADLYYASDMRTFRVPCPHCRHYQELRFFPHKEGPFVGKGGIHGLRDAKGNWLTPEQAREKAWYQCESCEKKIDDIAKALMIPKGVWCPKGQTVSAKGELEGEPLRGKRHAGFHLSRLYAPIEVCTFGAIAAEYLAARDNQGLLQIFFNDWLGLPFEASTKTPAWSELRRLCVDVPRGSIHPEAAFLTMGCDVQHDRVYWVVRAWGAREGLPTSWVVDWGESYCDREASGEPVRGSDLTKLVPILDRVWPVHLAERTYPVSLALIDSGYAVRNSEVYDFCRGRGHKLRAIKGETKIQGGFGRWQKTEVERSGADGSKISNFELWLVNVSLYKGDIRGRWNVPTDKPGAWALCRAGDAEEQFLRQLVNEQEVHTVDKRGRPVVLWINQKNGMGCDWWDCEVYARAAADMWIGAAGWPTMRTILAKAASRSTPTPARPKTGPKPFVRPPSPGFLRR